MSNGFVPAEGQPPEAPENLQFERVEPSASGALPGLKAGDAREAHGVRDVRRCQFCGQELFGTYFEIDSWLACVPCHDRFEEKWRSSSGPARVVKAVGAGLVAGVVGAVLYYGIRAATGYDFGLIAIVVGVLVGKAVRWGSAGRGGRGYQVLAMLLTYLAIGGTYMPAALEAMAKREAKIAQAAKTAQMSQAPTVPGSVPAPGVAPKPAQAGKPARAKPSVPLRLFGVLLILGGLLLLCAALPILVGIESPFVLVIVAIGLYEAWKMSRPADGQRVAGPFTLGSREPLPPVG